MLNTRYLQEFEMLVDLPVKASLFAVPVIVHPQLAKQAFPGCPLLPHFKAVHDTLGEILEGPDGGQSWALLDRIVSPSFIAKILSGNEQETATALVMGHLRELEDPFFTLENYFEDDAIDGAKSVIGFMAGAVYRQNEDPNPIELSLGDGWADSDQRHTIEALLSGGRSMLRHLVLAPVPMKEALLNGFEGLSRMYVDFHGEDAKVDVTIDQGGTIVLTVAAGQRATEFSVAPGTLAQAQIEELLVRMEALRRSPYRIFTPRGAEDLGVSPPIH